MAKIGVLPKGLGTIHALDYLEEGAKRVYFAVPPGKRLMSASGVDCKHVGCNIYRATIYSAPQWRGMY